MRSITFLCFLLTGLLTALRAEEGKAKLIGDLVVDDDSGRFLLPQTISPKDNYAIEVQILKGEFYFYLSLISKNDSKWTVERISALTFGETDSIHVKWSKDENVLLLNTLTNGNPAAWEFRLWKRLPSAHVPNYFERVAFSALEKKINVLMRRGDLIVQEFNGDQQKLIVGCASVNEDNILSSVDSFLIDLSASETVGERIAGGEGIKKLREMGFQVKPMETLDECCEVIEMGVDIQRDIEKWRSGLGSK